MGVQTAQTEKDSDIKGFRYSFSYGDISSESGSCRERSLLSLIPVIKDGKLGAVAE